jgi:hypothetical protein
MVIDPNGKYLMAGRTGNTTSSSFILTRLESFGAYDGTFGTNSLVSTNFVSGTINQCNELIIQSDQKIIAIGFGGQGMAIARYLGIQQTNLNEFNLVSPANASTNQPFTFLSLDWSDAEGAAGYIVEWDTDEAFTSPAASNEIISQALLSDLIPNTTYYWRVKAFTQSEVGNYIGPWSFTTVGLNNFNLQLPANNATNIAVASVTFNWTDVAGATGYEMQLDTDNTFNSPQISTPTASTTAVTTLNTNTTYYWRVRATQGTVWGDWSSVWSFTTAAPQSINTVENVQFEVYPTPANDYLVFTSSTAISDEILIIDGQGKIVKTEPIYSTSKRIDVSTLANGFYTISLKKDHKAQMILIQH